MKPRLPSSRSAARGNTAWLSHSAEWGARKLCANSRAVSRTCSCSSVSNIFLLGDLAPRGLARLEEFTRHDQLLHFGGAFVDAQSANFAVKRLDLDADA